MKNDLISREALLKKIFPYGMPDDGNYSINAKAVRKAIEEAEAAQREKIYVVTKSDNIITATTNASLATRIVKKFSDSEEDAKIEIFDDAKKLLLPCWVVYFEVDGSVINIFDNSHYVSSYNEVGRCYRSGSGRIYVTVSADNSDEAVKLAAKARVKFLKNLN